jgi:UDP-4-amino-4,6-dideoxy-N-acetyl-beta-L-altrosamine N-acetyltransferase
MTLRPAVDADLETIRRWRNHPKVRRASIATAEITLATHLDWWKRVAKDPGSRVLIFEYRSEPVGVVIFKDYDPAAGSAEWGFFLDVEHPALVAAWIALERAAVAYAFDVLGLTALGGRTLAWNASVLELHRRTGFVEVPGRTYTTDIEGVPQRVVWMELRR